MKTVAALFVETDGCYFRAPDVDPWDEQRDARLYCGTDPVVAHPPCQRWGRYWSGGPNPTTPRKLKGDDAGCFAAALTAVRAVGGVIEHPEASHAWAHFGLTKPPRNGGWIRADDIGGWTCCVAQGNYGHVGNKFTWLYSLGTLRPELIWGKSDKRVKLEPGGHSTAERRARQIKTGLVQRMSAKQRMRTPIEFRDLLLEIARSALPIAAAD